MSKQIRQGDVFLERIDAIPKSTTTVPLENGRLILAHGEATGHAHVIKAKRAKLTVTATGERFLRVMTAGELVHNEHDAIPVAKGNYRVVRQKEYAPEAIRNVAD
jgi:hypothetical protein